MSEPLLNVMKIMLLAGLYLFFVRVLWSVFSELRDPRTLARKRAKSAAASQAGRTTSRRPQAGAPAPVPNPAPAPVPAMQVAAQGGAVGVISAVAHGQLLISDPPQLAGTTYTIGAAITIGRAATNGIVLDDTYVSTVHARVFHTSGTYFIEDLASRNGSTINGVALVATTPLSPGDRLQLGATTLEFS